MKTLLYYDLRDTARFIVPLLLFDIFAAFVVIIDRAFLSSDWMHFAAVLLMVISFALTVVMPPLIVLLRYYKTMYGEVAYLTHSFPVTTADKLNSKIALFFIWCIVQILVLIAQTSVFINQYALDEWTLEVGFWKSFSELFQLLNFSFIQLVGVIAAFFVFVIFYIISQAVHFFFVISLSVRLFSTRHVILGILVITIAFQFIGTALSSVLTMALPYVTIVDFSHNLNIEWLAKIQTDSYFEWLFNSNEEENMIFPIVNWVLSILYFVIFYGGTYHFLKNRISLN